MIREGEGPSDGSRAGGALVGVLLFVLPIFAAAGPSLLPLNVGVGQLYAFRLATLIGVPILVLIAAPIPRSADIVNGLLIAVGACWLTWGLASLLWTPNPRAGLVELVSIAFGALASSVIVIGVAGSRARLRLVVLGWATAFVLIAVIATWEVVTGRHLQSSFATTMSSLDSTLFVSATFGNPNALGAFLLMAEPLFLWQCVESTNWLRRGLWGIGILAAPVLMILGGSRMALVGTIVCVVVFVWSAGSWRQRISFVGFATVAGALGVWAFLQATGMSANDLLIDWRLAGELQYGGSTGVRLNLFRNGWEMILGTSGMGVGAGGFVHAIEHGFGRFDTGGIVNPHNYWLEIGAQYGLLVLVLALLTLAWWTTLLLSSLSRARSADDRTGLALAAAGVAGVVAFVIAAGSNSTFISQPTNWAFLGTLAALIGVSVVQSADDRES